MITIKQAEAMVEGLTRTKLVRMTIDVPAESFAAFLELEEVTANEVSAATLAQIARAATVEGSS